MRRFLAIGVLLLSACALTQHDFSVVVRHEAPAVVRVGAFGAKLADEPAQQEPPEADPGPETGAPGMTLGSGFLISEDGYVMTNAHLVDDAPADGVIVRLADRRDFKARVVGLDSVSDIALLKIEARGLPHVRLGDPRALAPGQWVAAIGAPLGLESSVSAGIVSAVGRTLPEESYLPFIQTDVAINPGNSGGPLFNLRGEVVGVNSVIYSMSGGSIGLSFAVPIDVAMGVAAALKAHGKVTRGRIGVRLQELTPELARAFAAPAAGALIVDVMKGGPADAGGVRAGDIVVSFAGHPIASYVDLMRLVADTPPGELAEMTYLRSARRASTRVRVEETRIAAPAPKEARMVSDPLGLLLAPLARKERERLGLESGVLVRLAEGAAQRVGLEPGDIILSVNGIPVETPYAFHERLREAAKGASVALLVQRDGARSFVALRLAD